MIPYLIGRGGEGSSAADFPAAGLARQVRTPKGHNEPSVLFSCHVAADNCSPFVLISFVFVSVLFFGRFLCHVAATRLSHCRTNSIEVREKRHFVLHLREISLHSKD